MWLLWGLQPHSTGKETLVDPSIRIDEASRMRRLPAIANLRSDGRLLERYARFSALSSCLSVVVHTLDGASRPGLA